MRINRAIGLGIGILVLQLLMSEVFFAFERALITTFDTTSTLLGTVEQGVQHASTTFPNLHPQVR